MTDKNIEIKLGNSKESFIGIIQNFDVFLNNKKITDGGRNQSVIVINKSNFPLKIQTHNKFDINYIENNQSYVGHLFVKEEYRGGLGKNIYQALSNKLNIEILKGDPISPQAKKMWNKFGDKISPQRN